MPPEPVEDPDDDYNLDIGDDEEGHHVKFEVLMTLITLTTIEAERKKIRLIKMTLDIA